MDLRDLFKVVRYLEALHILVLCMRTELRTNTRKDAPWTIRASLWYLLKLMSFFSGALGDVRCEGLPSRQNVKSVK